VTPTLRMSSGIHACCRMMTRLIMRRPRQKSTSQASDTIRTSCPATTRLKSCIALTDEKVSRM